jgi:hypothetical protein
MAAFWICIMEGFRKVADTHHNNAGPDPVFHFIVDPDPDPAPQQSN